MSHLDFSHISFLTVLLVYAAGLATSLTPCIYPLIPVVIGFLGNQTGNTSSRFMAAALYVTGLSLVYAALGLVAALTGRLFGELTTNSTVYLIFGLLLLFLGGQMMDFYQIPLPTFFTSGHPERTRSKNNLLTSFLVGASSGLVASPCTAPILGGLLFYIGSQRAYFKGAGLMMTFALGMNTILLVLGLSASAFKNIPRSGIWMVKIKQILAALLLGSGIYFIFKAGQLS